MESIETTSRLPRKRGFYVRMKLNGGRNPAKPFCYRFFKYVIWFSISLYFLSSFVITRHKPTISRTTISRFKSSRALAEEPRLDSSAVRVSDGMFKGMKVYVYDLPARFNSEWLANERCSRHLFAAEVAIHRALLSSDVRTFEPSQADFFFVPVYVSCNFSKVNGFPAIGHARSLMAAAVQHISVQLPFWNRSLGSDHVFVASHDFGACFHTMVRSACISCSGFCCVYVSISELILMNPCRRIWRWRRGCRSF